MPEMRKCKECGNLFIPKGREQYCSAIHYRPCPICGTPTVVKYLSDPPRRCDNCARKRNTAHSDSHPTSQPANESKSETGFKKHRSLFANIVWGNSTVEKSATDKTQIDKDTNTNENNDVDYSYLAKKITEVKDQAEFCESCTGHIFKYIGVKLRNNFIPGHDYLIKVSHDDYNYVVESSEDLTSNETVDYLMHIASQISFYQYFADASNLSKAN